jgi:hypothetical protein
MALSTVTIGETLSNTLINQLVNVLEQPSGGQELGHYKIQGSSYSSSAYISANLVTLSRNATPVSLGVTTVDQVPSNIASPSTGHLTAGGGQIYGQATTSAQACGVAGTYTMQY